jgi:DNA-binding CsgD family transcriptional regulator
MGICKYCGSEINPAKLTGCELKVARLACSGKSNNEIAKELQVAYSTIRTHIMNIYGKFEVHNHHGLVKEMLKNEYICMEDFKK